jgi:hypothetical protein
MSRLLQRELFETKRQLEYFSAKELSMQLGAEPRRWGVVLMKELIDNALDACETAGTPPNITISVTPHGFTVADNGLGMTQALIDRSLNYDTRTSDKTYYVSPSRGPLGNALKCAWAAPYAVDPEAPGCVEVRAWVGSIASAPASIRLPRSRGLHTASPKCRFVKRARPSRSSRRR